MAGKREICFDAAKGLAIFAVVLIHSINFLKWTNPILAHVIVSFYMPIFFIISGYFGYNNKYSPRIIIKKKFKELIFPYLTIGLLINIMGHYLFGNVILEHYLLDESKGGFWFLIVLFFCFVFYAFAKGISKGNDKMLFSILVLLYIVFFFLAFISPSWVYDAFSLPSFRKFLPFFIIGLFLRKEEKSIHPWSIKMLIMSGIIYLSLIWIPINKNITGMCVWSICALGGSLFIINVFKYTSISVRLLSFWGRYSLTIYIYHYIFMYILKAITPPVRRMLFVWVFSNHNQHLIHNLSSNCYFLLGLHRTSMR